MTINLGNILAIIFFCISVTFIVLFLLKGDNNLKDDLASVIYETQTLKKISKSQADCIADKFHSVINSDPIKMAATIGGLCITYNSKQRSINNNSNLTPTCYKYLSDSTNDLGNLSTECLNVK